jgi:ssRNA-specific RNase YbeY (16S rRNA maturation enzyme)
MKEHVDANSYKTTKVLGFPVNKATHASINGTINGSVVLPLMTLAKEAVKKILEKYNII